MCVPVTPLILTARLQYARANVLSTSVTARLAEAGIIVDELIESFEKEETNG
jgi:hypothetical protein